MNESELSSHGPSLELLQKEIAELRSQIVRISHERDEFHKAVNRLLRQIEVPKVEEPEFEEALVDPIDFKAFIQSDFFKT